MSIDDRLALLEKKLRFTRLTLTALLLGLAVVCAVGAGGPFTDLVCRSLCVKSPDGKTVVELSDSGELKASGTITANGVDILSDIASQKQALKSQQQALKRQQDETAKMINEVKASVAGATVKVGTCEWGFGLGTQANRGRCAAIREERVHSGSSLGQESHWRRTDGLWVYE